MRGNRKNVKAEYNVEVLTSDGSDASNLLGNHKCIICGKSFDRELLLYVHITSHSQDIHSLESGKDFGYVTQDVQNESKNYTCISCGFATGILNTMISHIRTHLSYPYNKENRIPEEVAAEVLNGAECGDSFHDKERLDHRVENQHKDFHQCDICRKACEDKYDLAWHMKNKHELHGSKCNTCDKVHPGGVTSENADVPCDFCDHTLTKLHPLDQIMNSPETLEVKDEESFGDQSFHEGAFECDTCKECFSCKRDLLCHLKTHLKDSSRKRERQRKSAEEGEIEKTIYGKIGKKKLSKADKPFKCDEENCRYATNQYSRLAAHKFKHNPFFKCVTCQEKFSSRIELKNHMSTHGERPFKCDQCNKCYKDKHGLGWHKKVQHDPSRLKFTCELCGKTYPFDSLLTQHINLTHAAEKQSVCDICGKNVSKTYLPMHRRTHGEKQYSCDICEKTFLEKAYLKRHKMVHTGEKPYVCSVCGNSFRQHSTLTIHMRTHTGDRPYKCVLCENAYKTHHNLKKHYKRSGHKLV